MISSSKILSLLIFSLIHFFRFNIMLRRVPHLFQILLILGIIYHLLDQESFSYLLIIYFIRSLYILNHVFIHSFEL